MKNFIKLIRFLKPYKKWVILSLGLILLEIVMDLLLPIIMANIINIGIGNRNITYITINIIIMIILTILGIIGGISSSYYSSKASQYSDADIRKTIMQKVSSLSFYNLDKLKTGHLITIITNDITLIGTVIMYGLRFLIRVPIVVIGSIIMAIIISPKLSSIMIIVIPIMVILVTIIMTKAFPLFTRLQTCVDDVNTNIRENLGGIRVVKAFVSEEFEKQKFDKSNTKLKNTTIKAVKTLIMALPLVMLLINLAIVVVLWVGGIDVINGNMKIGNIIAFIQYLTNILSSIMMASMVIVMVSRSEASAKRINEILDINDNFINNDKKPDIDGKIEFIDVDFSYDQGSGDLVLKDLNFTIEKGELVVIMGPTGSGKTSLTNLIGRLYDINKGKILIDGIDIKDIDIKTLRKNIGISYQQPFIFSDTILNNIKYGNEKASLNEVKKASKIACLDEFILSKKEKYDYMLEQRGTNLSGGQKQRLMIARTVLPHPKIIILDDVTSAVDMKTEKMIRDNFKKYLDDCTTIIVASRVAMAMEADKIILMDDGKIVGIGSHNELLKTNKLYKEIYNSQIKDGDIDGR